jgi:ribonuclease HI
MSKLTGYTDGACRVSNPGLCASGFAILRGEELIFESARVLDGLQTNNHAEYQGLLDLLRYAESNSLDEIAIFSDSALVVNQTNGRWKTRPPLDELTNKAFGLLHATRSTLVHIKGHNGNLGNERVDALCNAVLDKFQGK